MPPNGRVVIAIDGPAASGKSTVARRLAALLRFLYVDSGALYRAVTWSALRAGVNPADPTAVRQLARNISLSFEIADGAVRFRVEGFDPGDELRSQAVNEHVSPVAAVPDVRGRVNQWLRSLAELGNLVVEGRDIGTAVFPETPFKFYLDADPLERARRRQREMTASGGEATLDEVGAALARRDHYDRSRSLDPLRIAPGAVVVDTTLLSIDEVVRAILSRLPPDLR
jgi:cytidylate kinase